jgi:hypothetical protein
MSQKNDFFSNLQKMNPLEIAWLLILMASKSFEHRTAMDSLNVVRRSLYKRIPYVLSDNHK